jgi:hypothetical protein
MRLSKKDVKTGDRILVRTCMDNKHAENKICTILATSSNIAIDDHYFAAEFDEDIKGHEFSGESYITNNFTVKAGCGWFVCFVEDLELISSSGATNNLTKKTDWRDDYKKI